MNIHTDISDEDLMARIIGGDHQAFAALVNRHTNKFFGAAYRTCGQTQDAEDIVQDAFLKLWNKREQWNPNKGAKFTTWFYRIVTNTAVDHMRKKKPEHGSEFLDRFPDTRTTQDEEIHLSGQQKALEEAIQALPERQKVALNLCFYEGVSNKEAAEIMGVGVKALESLLMRAKRSLKKMVKGEKETGTNQEKKYA